MAPADPPQGLRHAMLSLLSTSARQICTCVSLGVFSLSIHITCQPVCASCKLAMRRHRRQRQRGGIDGWLIYLGCNVGCAEADTDRGSQARVITSRLKSVVA